MTSSWKFPVSELLETKYPEVTPKLLHRGLILHLMLFQYLRLIMILHIKLTHIPHLRAATWQYIFSVGVPILLSLHQAGISNSMLILPIIFSLISLPLLSAWWLPTQSSIYAI